MSTERKRKYGSSKKGEAENRTVDVFDSSHFHTKYGRQGRGPNLLMQRRALFAVILYKCIRCRNQFLPTSKHLPLCALAPPQPHGLAVFLKLCDKLISLSYNVIILLVLVVWSVGLDDALSSHTVNGTWDSLCCNEFCKITRKSQQDKSQVPISLAYRSKKSTETPKSFAILSSPTTR